MNIPHRAFGWKYDLPSPNAPTQLEARTAHLNPPPNHIDNNHIELPRNTVETRGILTALGALTLLIVTIGTLLLTYANIAWDGKFDLRISGISIIILLIAFLIIPPYIRMDLELPCNEPIRFNKLRRKVYFYQYRHDLLRPFGRANWGIKPVVYDWDDLTAEAYRGYAPMGYGGLKEKIMISVCKPGTDEVIDRIYFTDDIEKGEQYWAIARVFMQEGAEALPEFVNPPWDWNEGIYSNPFEQRAPKVQWPTEMDLESRTAPAPEEYP
ncbi:DUF6708 domain-containing protein [Pseudomonas sp. NPDC089996]|uniref:DUF6708 domain-containing protein n=1 Tax=Pseudomonas sp. NPDC089996 TaxID=3364474 RepID=UPI00381D4D11